MSNDSFSYFDDVFFETSKPVYAKGYTETTTDFRDVITVELGGVNNNDISGMSGGWSRNFDLEQESIVAVSITFQLQIDKHFEPSEETKVLCSIDGEFVNNGSDYYLALLAGDGDSGEDMFIGFTNLELSPRYLEAGTHTILVGGYLSAKTQIQERSFIRFDRIRVVASTEEFPGIRYL